MIFILEWFFFSLYSQHSSSSSYFWMRHTMRDEKEPSEEWKVGVNRGNVLWRPHTGEFISILSTSRKKHTTRLNAPNTKESPRGRSWRRSEKSSSATSACSGHLWLFHAWKKSFGPSHGVGMHRSRCALCQTHKNMRTWIWTDDKKTDSNKRGPPATAAGLGSLKTPIYTRAFTEHFSPLCSEMWNMLQ